MRSAGDPTGSAGAPTGEAPRTVTAATPWRPRFGDTGRAARRRLERVSPSMWVTFGVVALATVWVAGILHPDLILTENTPTGGDMGSHVWGPQFLLDELLPRFRLSGWAPDWYAGFPAFQFYMVVPFLLIVAVHLGLQGALWVPVVALSVAGAVALATVPALARWRRPLIVLLGVVTVLVLPVPYGVAFKLVAVAGLVTLPVAAWAFGRLTDLPFPVPALLSVSTLFFIANREPTLNSGTGNIIGGNLASTMAGEFAFSISLTLAVVYLGLLVRGMRTGRHRVLSAGVLALCGLCHIIPAFYALVGTAVALVLWPGVRRLWWVASTGVVAGLLGAFWALPFVVRHAYVNDMGWIRLPREGATLPNGDPQTVWSYLASPGIRWALGFAAVGLVASTVFWHRSGIMLALMAVVAGAAFVWVPQGRLWNARVLPLYYLALFLLGAIGLGLVIRAVAIVVAREPARPPALVGGIAAPVCLAAAIFIVGVPMAAVPIGRAIDNGDGSRSWELGPISYNGGEANGVRGWAEWNFSGLEAKPPVIGEGGKAPEGEGGWPEFRGLVNTMGAVGRDASHGCGRAFWEYGERLETYGTPMAPMMLPYFTDGCIDSMEGLYFESSATTPHHFLTQCALSASGSCAQRDLAYERFDFDLGIRQLERLGGRYYLAFSDRAVAAADASDRVTQIASSGPWRIYELTAPQARTVTSLSCQPAVMTNVGDTQSSWLDPAAAWFLDPSGWEVPLAVDGPRSWPRVELDEVPETRPDGTRRRVGDRPLPDVPCDAVPGTAVTDIGGDEDSISFSVDRTDGLVLVKTSAFPNWVADGAEGPWRVTPNLMVVAPTEREVELTFARSTVDLSGAALSAAGVGGLGLLAWLGPVALPPARRRRSGRGGGPGESDEAPEEAGVPGQPGSNDTTRDDTGLGDTASDDASLDGTGLGDTASEGAGTGGVVGDHDAGDATVAGPIVGAAGTAVTAPDPTKPAGSPEPVQPVGDPAGGWWSLRAGARAGGDEPPWPAGAEPGSDRGDQPPGPPEDLGDPAGRMTWSARPGTRPERPGTRPERPETWPERPARSLLRRFAVVGTGVTALDIGVFMLLRRRGWSVRAADTAAVAGATAASYAGHRAVTFADDPEVRWVRDPWSFLVTAAATGAVDVALCDQLSRRWAPAGRLARVCGPKLAAVATAGLVRAGAYRSVLFSQVRADQSAPGGRPAPPGDRRLSVIVPAYREAAGIAGTIAALRSALADLDAGGDLEIVVVDDGSGDDTAEAARAAGADRVLARPANTGKGAAVRAGLAVATGRCVAFTDADLAYDPAQLRGLLDRVEGGWDMVVGSRRHTQAITLVRARRARELGGRVVNRLTHAVLLGQYRDTQCGLKAMRSDVARVAVDHGRIDGFAFDVELFHLVERHRWSLAEVPVEVSNSARSSVRVVVDGLGLVRDLGRIARLSRRGAYDLDAAKGTRLSAGHGAPSDPDAPIG